MRKIFIILTLMVSSFFIFNTSVKADTMSYIIDEKDFNYLTDDFYKARELAIEHATANDLYYMIGHKATTDPEILVYFFSKGTYQYELNSSNYIRLFMSATFDTYKYNNGALTYYAQYGSIYKELINSDYTNLFSYFMYLDTNMELHTCEETGHTFTLTYNDFTHTFTSEEHFPSLYEFKTLMENSSVEDEESDEVVGNDSLDSFYSLVIEKIKLFANSFITNDMLLFVIGIFILIFVIELIRRYLL